MTTPSPTPPIPVDRNWINKLLQKYPNPTSRRPILAKNGEENDNGNDDTTIKALVVAPMVDQSDLPFRLLCRRYGANLCFTPMVHAKLVVQSMRYRQKFIGNFILQDRPLIAQICGSDPETVLEAARLLEPHVDGIDINCGCPQGIAKRGNYGAYLLEQEDELLTLVRYLVQHLTVPLSVKVRLLPPTRDDGNNDDCDDENDDCLDENKIEEEYGSDNDDDQKEQVQGEEGTDPPINNDVCSSNNKKNKNTCKNVISQQKSLELYTKLVDAGIHLLTIHGRTRHEKGPQKLRNPDWETIRAAVDLLGHRIPIFANGGIETFQDVQECLAITNADGVMSSESVLEYPPLFYDINSHNQHQNNTTTTSTTTSNNTQQETKEYSSSVENNFKSDTRTVGRLQLAQEYMDLAHQYPPEKGGQGSGLKCIRIHIHRFLHADLQSNPTIRDIVVREDTVEGLQRAIDEIRAFRTMDETACSSSSSDGSNGKVNGNGESSLELSSSHDVTKEKLSWYLRHRRSPEERAAQARLLAEYVAQRAGEEVKEEVEAADCCSTFFNNMATGDDVGDY
jgi:tRNA-dihydrouridine synthase